MPTWFLAPIAGLKLPTLISFVIGLLSAVALSPEWLAVNLF
jgi:hypothetical protein